MKQKTVSFHECTKEHDGKLRDAVRVSYQDSRKQKQKQKQPKIDWSKIPASLKRKFRKRGFKKHHFNIPNVRKLILDYNRETGYCI